jgi:hypothetical protein
MTVSRNTPINNPTGEIMGWLEVDYDKITTWECDEYGSCFMGWWKGNSAHRHRLFTITPHFYVLVNSEILITALI